VIATLAIVLRILASRRRTLKLEDQITNDVEKLVSPGRRAELGPPACTKLPGVEGGGRGKKNDHFVTVVAVLMESALPSAILGILTPWRAPGFGPLLDARFLIRILWLA
jgi:hypothetical protein